MFLRGNFLHLRVGDGSRTPPRMVPSPPDADPAHPLLDHGRGLPIVALLNSGWGYALSDDAGKVVWATLRLRPLGPSEPGRDGGALA